MRYGKLYEEGVKRLRAAGVTEAESDCFILFSECFGLSRSSYFFKQTEEVPSSDVDKIEKYFSWLKRRECHEPVQYIIGNQEFCGFRFKVTPDVLIPRLDTEVLVDEILKREHGGDVLDLCTGSGCIIISLKRLGSFGEAVGTDISESALKVAEENARENFAKVTFFKGDLFDALSGSQYEGRLFDVITSNPPYIAEREKPELSPEVVDHEPSLALFAENEGLAFYERIIEKAPDHLKPGGRIYFEIGASQADAVMKLLKDRGFIDILKIKDLAGLDRIVTGHL